MDVLEHCKTAFTTWELWHDGDAEVSTFAKRWIWGSKTNTRVVSISWHPPEGNWIINLHKAVVDGVACKMQITKVCVTLDGAPSTIEAVKEKITNFVQN
jgi:hypothetical protein